MTWNSVFAWIWLPVSQMLFIVIAWYHLALWGQSNQYLTDRVRMKLTKEGNGKCFWNYTSIGTLKKRFKSIGHLISAGLFTELQQFDTPVLINTDHPNCLKPSFSSLTTLMDKCLLFWGSMSFFSSLFSVCCRCFIWTPIMVIRQIWFWSFRLFTVLHSGPFSSS